MRKCYRITDSDKNLRGWIIMRKDITKKYAYSKDAKYLGYYDKELDLTLDDKGWLVGCGCLLKKLILN